MKQKFAEGLADYCKLTEQILTYSQHIRFEGAFGRGNNDMDIWSLDWASLAAEEIIAFYEGVMAGMGGEDPPPPPPGDEPTLDALQRKGKGKGKGKRGQGWSSGGPVSNAYS